MKEDKEKEKLIKRYYKKMFKNFPLDEQIKASVTYDKICRYYIVNLYVPFKHSIARTIVDYSEYVKIKRKLSK